MANHQMMLIGGGRQPTKIMSLGELDLLMDAQVAQMTPGGELQRAYQKVAWLFRGVNMRAQAIAGLPFGVFRNGKEIDPSDDWQNEVGFLDDPKRLLWLVTASLTLLGRCYLFREQNRVKLLNLKYLLPTTITPTISPDQGLTGFKRRLNAQLLDLATEDLVYFWLPDPFKEVGEPAAWPAKAALVAANVLMNLDEFADKFFQRGAIKATVLTVDGNPPQGEKDRLKEWWTRMFGGIRQAWQTEVVNAAVKPVIVGEGVKELENETLSANKREQIAAALEIPQTMLFSGSASGLGGGNVADADTIHFANDFIVPFSSFLAEILNHQVFAPLGLQWRFKTETLGQLQVDELKRAQTFKFYLDSLGPTYAGMIGEMLGLRLPSGWTYDDLAGATPLTRQNQPEGPSRVEAENPNAPALEAQDQSREPNYGGATPPVETAAKALEHSQFLRYARKHAGNPAKVSSFRFLHLDAGEIEAARKAAGVPFSADGDLTFGGSHHKSLMANFDAAVEKRMPRMARAVRACMQDQKEAWLAAVNKEVKAGPLDEPDQTEYDLQLRERVGPVLARIVHEGGQDALDRLKLGLAFDLKDEHALRAMAQQAQTFAQEVNATTWQQLKDSLAAGYEAGESIADLSRRVTEIMQNRIRSSAETIARTETQRAYNQGTVYGWEESGEVTGKKWLATLDDRVREAHAAAHGQTVPLNEPFIVDGEALMYPGDPDGDPGNIINCRCTVTPVLRGD